MGTLWLSFNYVNIMTLPHRLVMRSQRLLFMYGATDRQFRNGPYSSVVSGLGFPLWGTTDGDGTRGGFLEDRNVIFPDLAGWYVIYTHQVINFAVCTLLCMFHFNFNKRQRQPWKRYLKNTQKTEV